MPSAWQEVTKALWRRGFGAAWRSQRPRIRRKAGSLLFRGTCDRRWRDRRRLPSSEGDLLAFLAPPPGSGVFALVALAVMTVAGVSAARAVEAVNVRTDAAAIDLTDAVELAAHRRRPHPGFDRARRRRHRAPHRGARARSRTTTGRCSRSPITATSRSTASSSRRITAWSAPA